MQWITDEDLRTWSKRTDARELFVDLVGDLIRATVADITKFRFPGQSAGTLRGFDGDLEVASDKSDSRVPVGASKWEFGTTPIGKGKAEADYKKRTSKTPADVMAKNAFVMLNLHNWDTPRDLLANWEAEKKREGKWRDVQFIDGTGLQKWLEEKPAVAARYARNVLGKAPKNGALSTDEFWERFSASFRPALTEAMVLCGRTEEARCLLEVLVGGAQNFTIGAENSEEVIAFAVATIRSAPQDVRGLLEAKTMIVETVEAAQFLHGRKDMVYLVWRSAEQLAASLGQRGPTLTAATGIQRKRQGLMQLNRPSASAMAEAMGTMNIERQEAYDLAQKCGRSLVILRRLSPAAGIDAPAEWAGQAKALKPALLAGGWTADSQLDREVVALLGGSDYLAVEKPVRETLGMSDPPFDKVEQVWQVRAAVDAFPYYGHLVDEEDLARLKAAAVKVLSHHVVQPNAEEKFSLNYRAQEDYSNWLRDGLAYTLNLFAVMPKVGGLEFSGTTPQRYVDDVIRSLPEYAKSHRWILPILTQLAVLAEAAPIPFLEALEKSLEGATNDALNFFEESDTNDFLFAKTSPHVYVLWALEVLAWDPNLLPRVTVIFGKLAKIDPKSKSKNGNRPLGSLRRIFVAWSPNTDADLNKRIKALDGLIRVLPDVAWELLLELAPHSHDTSSPTARPKLRDTTPMSPEILTFGLVWETEAKLLERALNLARGNDERIVQLVDNLASYQPSNRATLVEVFEVALADPQASADGKPLWHKLRDFISRHEAFPDTDWSLKGDELARLKKLVELRRPTDIVAQARHLFDDWIPRLGTNMSTDLHDAEESRATALQQVYKDVGVEGLLKLAKTVKLPRQMGQAFEKISLPFDDAATLIFHLIDTGGECYDLSCLVSGALRRRDPEAWANYFERIVLPRAKSIKDAAWLLASWPDNRETWAFADHLGKEFANVYWKEFGSIPYQGSDEDFALAINRLRQEGRSLRVITSLHQRVKDVPSQTLVELLDESVPEIASGGGASMLSYAIREVFETLSARGDLAPVEVARREYVYLPLIEGSVKGLAVHKLLATEPSEYMDILKNVYAGKNDQPIESPSEEDRRKARMSYRLLKSFHTVPGEGADGAIDAAALRDWVLEVRRLAIASDRAEIADEFLGQLLAHAKADSSSGAWPPPPVQNLLEELASETVERGIEIERFNMRGGHWKSIDEGGAQERDLAAICRGWAEKTSSPRTSAMLERVAAGWDEAAHRADISAEQEKLRR